jgi:hypothetical protein
VADPLSTPFFFDERTRTKFNAPPTQKSKLATIPEKKNAREILLKTCSIIVANSSDNVQAAFAISKVISKKNVPQITAKKEITYAFRITPLIINSWTIRRFSRRPFSSISLPCHPAGIDVITFGRWLQFFGPDGGFLYVEVAPCDDTDLHASNRAGDGTVAASIKTELCLLFRPRYPFQKMVF